MNAIQRAQKIAAAVFSDPEGKDRDLAEQYAEYERRVNDPNQTIEGER